MKLKISDLHFTELRDFLFKDNYQERVAIGLCSRSGDVFYLHRLELIQEDKVISRDEWNITWDMGEVQPLLSYIRRHSSSNWSVIKFHNHPNGYDRFSEADDDSDATLAQTVTDWIEGLGEILSCVLLPQGEMFGRLLNSNGEQTLLKITINGGRSLIQDITYKRDQLTSANERELNLRNKQVLGSATHARLKLLKLGVVGYSGLGSPLVEQLIRLGCENLVVVDPDKIEEKNLNRILNSTSADIGSFKTEIAHRTAVSINPDCILYPINEDIAHPTAVEALSHCDVIFGCMDSIDGRHILNSLSTTYIIPYIDLGVGLLAKQDGGINCIEYRIDFVEPGGSSLLTREVYTCNQLESAMLLRSAPDHYEKKVKEGYIDKVVDNSAPAVLPINMEVAAKAILYFLDRLHQFVDWGRDYYNDCPVRITGDLAYVKPSFAMKLSKGSDFATDILLKQQLGKASNYSLNKFRHVERNT